jgi:hypothetical protein
MRLGRLLAAASQGTDALERLLGVVRFVLVGAPAMRVALARAPRRRAHASQAGAAPRGLLLGPRQGA